MLIVKIISLEMRALEPGGGVLQGIAGSFHGSHHHVASRSYHGLRHPKIHGEYGDIPSGKLT